MMALEGSEPGSRSDVTGSEFTVVPASRRSDGLEAHERPVGDPGGAFASAELHELDAVLTNGGHWSDFDAEIPFYNG